MKEIIDPDKFLSDIDNGKSIKDSLKDQMKAKIKILKIHKIIMKIFLYIFFIGFFYFLIRIFFKLNDVLGFEKTIISLLVLISFRLYLTMFMKND